MNDKGKLLIVSGFSGAGKGTIMKKYFELYPDESVLCVSATTRLPRPGEKDGEAYFFKTEEEFKNMIKEDKFLEYARFADNYYGTPKEWVYEQIEAGKNVFLEIEQQGAFQVKKKEPSAVMIFVVPPSRQELIRRLNERGTETKEQIEKRLARAAEEKEMIKYYDHVIINDEVEKSAEMLHTIVRS